MTGPKQLQWLIVTNLKVRGIDYVRGYKEKKQQSEAAPQHQRRCVQNGQIQDVRNKIRQLCIQEKFVGAHFPGNCPQPEAQGEEGCG